MTLGAVHASPPLAQRVPRQASGEWAIRNIGQKPKEPNCHNWRTQTDWPETQKDFEAPQIARPFSRTPIPPSVTLPRRGGRSGGVCRPSLCVPTEQLSMGRLPPDPAPSRPPVPVCGFPSGLFPESSPQQSSAGPPLGSLPAPSPEDPPRADTHCHPAAAQPILQQPCSPRFNSFNMLFLAKPLRGFCL